MTAVARSLFGEALLADGPNAEHAEALMLFGRFVGTWEFDWAGYDVDGRQAPWARGEWVFGWVLEGRAVQDVWILPPREHRSRPEGEYGTTIRVYDPVVDAWLVTWNGPLSRARRTLVARPAGDEILQEGRTDEGDPLRWIFSEIEERSCTWRSLASPDGGATWRLCEEMHVRRRTE